MPFGGADFFAAVDGLFRGSLLHNTVSATFIIALPAERSLQLLILGLS
jgi:hypothetical protein